MTTLDLAQIRERHSLWLASQPGGVRADLRAANLAGADLTGANLAGADLAGADLTGADLGTWFIRQVGPIGSRGDTLVLLARPATDDVPGVEEVRTGCFGAASARTLTQFAAANEERQDGNVQAQEQYRRAVEWLRAEMAAARVDEMATT